MAERSQDSHINQVSSGECAKRILALEPFTQKKFCFFPPGNDSDYRLTQPHFSTRHPHHFPNILSWYILLLNCAELALNSLRPTQTAMNLCDPPAPVSGIAGVTGLCHQVQIMVETYRFSFFHVGGQTHFPCVQDSTLLVSPSPSHSCP